MSHTVFRLTKGYVSLPEGADPGEFIISGGTRAAKAVIPAVSEPTKGLTLGELIRLYEENLPRGAKADTTAAMEGFHKAHLLRIFGPDVEIRTLALADVQRYANRRSREMYRGKPILPSTVLKELSTLRVIWNWGRKQGHVASDIPFQNKDLHFPRTEQKPPFQTFEAIQQTIERGGLTEGEQAALWECLYLTLDEVHEVMVHVRDHAKHPFIYPMFAFAAMTGARRSEICRSRVEDWDLGSRTVILREKKRKRGRSSYRTVDVNSALAGVMGEWLRNHPGGQSTICKDGGPLTVDMAHDHFKRTLAASRWAVIPGFHTFRHSFASILASRGVDETTIDRWMGHQTADQRERYRHLFPKNRKHAIELLCPESSGELAVIHKVHEG
jgi:integrase